MEWWAAEEVHDDPLIAMWRKSSDSNPRQSIDFRVSDFSTCFGYFLLTACLPWGLSLATHVSTSMRHQAQSWLGATLGIFQDKIAEEKSSGKVPGESGDVF